MKKPFLLLLVITIFLVFTGCSSSGEKASDHSLSDFISAFTEKGVEVDPNEKPMSQAIGAVDGVIFYWDQKPVKIYEYESEKALKDARSKYQPIKDFPSSGRFVIETKHDAAIEVFNSIK